LVEDFTPPPLCTRIYILLYHTIFSTDVYTQRNNEYSQIEFPQ
jgi:hypothetical protein